MYKSNDYTTCFKKQKSLLKRDYWEKNIPEQSEMFSKLFRSGRSLIGTILVSLYLIGLERFDCIINLKTHIGPASVGQGYVA